MSKSVKRHLDDYDSYKTGSKHDRSPSPAQNLKMNESKKIKASNTSRKPGIQIKLSAPKKVVQMKPKITVASAFNQESDSEPEEMPPEAKMRMRNIGRDTPTSAGPNSFGKTKHGFCDAKKVFEKSLKEAMNNADSEEN